jgi:hypothetical protein
MSGFARFKELVASRKKWVNNTQRSAISPETSLTAGQAFGNAASYYRAAAVIHTLRFYVGDSAFFKILRRWTYPDPAMESVTNGKQCRLATTNEFREIAEQVSGKKLDWFFKAYFREVGLPQLWYVQTDTSLTLRWTTDGGGNFPMPVEVSIAGQKVRVEMSGNRGTVAIPRGVSAVIIDPDGWLLTPTFKVTSVEGREADPQQPAIVCEVYPNPFNPTSVMKLVLARPARVKATVYSLLGQEIKTIVAADLTGGDHTYRLDLPRLSTGTYYLEVLADNHRSIHKLLLTK